MKRFKIALLALFFIPSAFAGVAPEICPDVGVIKETIRKTGFTKTEIHSWDGFKTAYFVCHIDKYGTPFNWQFCIEINSDMAVSEQDAINKATSALPYIWTEKQPHKPSTAESYEGLWICGYSGHYPTHAYTREIESIK